MNIDYSLIEKLKNAGVIAVLTGAGISKESGIPTFREAQTGLWEKYSPQELASPVAFENNPLMVWDWYRWRREVILNSEPNQAHHALAELESIKPRFSLITQNVDGLHLAAGSRNVIEMHGNIHRARCSQEHYTAEEWDMNGDFPPACPVCQSMLRPDIVWFGESIPNHIIHSALESCRGAEILLVVGTSGIVEPAASLPFIALSSGVLVVEINVEPTILYGYAQYSLLGQAATILPQLLDEIRS